MREQSKGSQVLIKKMPFHSVESRETKEAGAFPTVLIKLSISEESGLDGVKSHLQEKKGGKKTPLCCPIRPNKSSLNI